MSPHLKQLSSVPGESLGVTLQDNEYLAPWQWDLILSADIPSLPDNSTWPADLQDTAATQDACPVENPPLMTALAISPQLATQGTPEMSLSPSLLCLAQNSTPTSKMPPCPPKAGSCSPPRHKTRERRAFTEAEDQALKRGYEKHGSQWCLIAKDPAFKNQRTSTDVRDRFRNAFPDEYARAGYKPRAKALKRATDKPKTPFVTHHMRPTRYELSARRQKARSLETVPMSKSTSGPPSNDAKEPTDASTVPEPTRSTKGSHDVAGVSSALLSNELSQAASQAAGPLSTSPTSPAGSLPALTVPPLSPPDQKSTTATSWPVPTIKASKNGDARYSTPYAWTQPEAPMLPFLPARAQSMPFGTSLIEPSTPLELPSSRATANAFPYPDGGITQVLSASPSSMEHESAQTTHGPSTPGASPLSKPLPTSPTFPFLGFSVCDLPSSTSLGMADSLSATDSASRSRSAWNIPSSLATWPFLS